jgi:ubiquinone/menaquinone biosynthesis C-methylase UbiE
LDLGEPERSEKGMLQTDELAFDAVYVPESRFGTWFLGTETWAIHVLERAINDLERLIKNRRPSYPVIVDIGCGWGRSFKLLKQRFAAQRLIGVDIDPMILEAAAREVERLDISVELACAPSWDLTLPDQSVDMVFCHQTFHHLVDQENALVEFRRVLKPGGLLLFAESTRAYIHSWIIRLLFRHPMDVQRSADEYVAMIRAAGLAVDEDAVSLPYLWWSRSDLGLLERVCGIAPPAGHEETLINLVAVRP